MGRNRSLYTCLRPRARQRCRGNIYPSLLRLVLQRNLSERRKNLPSMTPSLCDLEWRERSRPPLQPKYRLSMVHPRLYRVPPFPLIQIMQAPVCPRAARMMNNSVPLLMQRGGHKLKKQFCGTLLRRRALMLNKHLLAPNPALPTRFFPPYRQFSLQYHKVHLRSVLITRMDPPCRLVSQ